MPIEIIDAKLHPFQGETITVPSSAGTRAAYTILPGYSAMMMNPWPR